MFISQVTFTAAKEHEEFVKAIVMKKQEKGVDWEGFIESVALRSESQSEVSYTWQTKWSSKEQHLAWMKRPEHIEGHKKMRQAEPDPNRPAITKTMQRYDVVSA